jgi:hypothetical protein
MELIEFLKGIFLGTVTIDIIKKKRQSIAVIGFDIFAPLLKRMNDYEHYSKCDKSMYAFYIDKNFFNDMNGNVSMQLKPQGKKL